MWKLSSLNCKNSHAVMNCFTGWLGGLKEKMIGRSMTRRPGRESCWWIYGNRYEVQGFLYHILILTTEYLLEKNFNKWLYRMTWPVNVTNSLSQSLLIEQWTKRKSYRYSDGGYAWVLAWASSYQGFSSYCHCWMSALPSNNRAQDCLQ